MDTKVYLKTLLILFFSISFKLSISQTINSPNVEDVWGGRINAIIGYSKTADTTGVYIATESSNSIFYSSVYNPVGAGFTFRRFKVLPTANSSQNLGSRIQLMDVHQASGKLFFVNNGLFSTSPTATSLTAVDSGNISALKIKDSVLIYIKGAQLHWGIINSSGTYTASASSPISISSPPSLPVVIDINPKNYDVYIGFGGAAPTAVKSNDNFYDLKSSTSFSNLTMGAIPPNTSYTGFGISPSGRIFFGGQRTMGFNTFKHFLYSDDGLSWTSVTTAVSGVTGTSIAFAGTDSSYVTYFAKCYSNNQGTSWAEFGNVSFQTHPNDGSVLADPNDSLTVYMTSDQGLAYSVNGGSIINEMDRGIEAVQVNDFTMTADKNTAWIASKAGIRKVSNYQSTKTWTRAKFPNGDGSPYFSAEMKPGDTNTVYVGNVRVYKTTDGGNSWSMRFTPENAPYSWPQTAIRCEAIEVCPWNSNIIMAGYYIQDSMKGGLFYSLDAGLTWSQQYLFVSSGSHDVDVHDIVFNIEGTDTIAYIGVEYDLAYPTGRSIYKLTKSGSGWTVSQDMNGATTSTGSLIVATIRDLHRSSTGDTIYACGTDAGVNEPVAYFKPISATGKWTPFTYVGLPISSGLQGYAITKGVDTMYLAVENDVYYLPSSTSNWQLGYSYPEGTEINFLYYDELLVGTESGLYGHLLFEEQPISLTLTAFIEGLYLGGNLMSAAPYNSNPSLSASVADTIIVELHSTSTPFTLIETDTVLLSTNGIAICNFPSYTNGNSYYVAIKHRNSIETWSASPVTLSASANYNFSTAANKAYGNNLKNSSGVYLIYSGDINQDGDIDYSDYPIIDLGSINGLTGYFPADLNGDGTIDYSDYPFIDNNSLNAISINRP